MFLYEISDAFDSQDLPYALVGGYALMLHGMVRATIDVDLVLNLKLADFEKAERIFSTLGLTSRLPVKGHEVYKMRHEYIENRNLIAWSFVDYANPSRLVDVIITHDRRKMKVQKVLVGGRLISVISLEDLLKMKIAAGRPQDLVDVQTIRAKMNAKS